MISARIAVEYEGHWTSQLRDYEVYGKFLAYKFADNQSFALLVLTSRDLGAAIEILEEHETVDSVNIIERESFRWQSWEHATLLVDSKYREIPPMELLTYEGFYLIGDPLLDEGKMYFDLFVNDRDALAYSVSLLEEFGAVSVRYLSETFQYQRIPRSADFERLLDHLTALQFQTLAVSVEAGYFDDTRQVTIAEIADRVGTTPSTASRHLRAAQMKALKFLNNTTRSGAHD